MFLTLQLKNVYEKYVYFHVLLMSVKSHQSRGNVKKVMTNISLKRDILPG